MSFKKKLLLSCILCGCVSILQASPQSAVSPADTLLQQARHLYPGNPAAGKAAAKKAGQAAGQRHQPAQQIKAMCLLAYFAYSEKDYRRGYAYADSAVSIGKGARIDSLTGDALVTRGGIQSAAGQFEKALNTFQEALDHYHGPGMTSRVATAYLNMGVCERKLGRFERAGRFYIRAAESYQQLHDEPSLAEAYNAIGNCFTSAGNYAQGIFYHQQALAIREKLHDQTAIAQSCSNLGYVLRLDHQPDDAIRYLSRALIIRKQDPDSSRLVLTLQNLGAAWKMKGNLPLAKTFITRSLQIAKNYQLEEELARGGLDMAEILLVQRQSPGALIYTEQAIHVAGRLHLPELLKNAYELKVRIAAQQKDYRTAFLFNQKAEGIKDSLMSVAKNKTISELEISYQSRQRKRDIATLTLRNNLEQRVNAQQRQLIIFMVIASALLIVLSAFLLIIYRQKVKTSRRVQTLHQELHHRVKNNLQILSSLFVMQIDSLNDEAAKAALRENESRLTSMNLIHHKLYQDRSTTTIAMQEYLTKLAQHIKDTFGQTGTAHITVQLDIAPLSMEADKAVAVGLIVNELLTNIFKYSFKKQPGTIRMSFQRHNDQEAILRLRDNGPAWEIPAPGLQASFGLRIVNLMASQLDTKLELEQPGFTSYRLVIRL